MDTLLRSQLLWYFLLYVSHLNMSWDLCHICSRIVVVVVYILYASFSGTEIVGNLHSPPKNT